MIGRSLAVSAALIAGCARPPPVENPSPFEEDDPAAIEAAAVEPPETETSDSEHALEDEPSATPSIVARGDLIAVLDRGPAAYGSSIAVEAVVDAGRLRGWKVTRWDVAWAGLQTGDVVVDVNGVVIEKPDDLMALWELLRDAVEISIRVQRDGVEHVRRFAVR